MANPVLTLSGQITYTDAAGNIPINRSVGNPSFSSATAVGDLTANQQLAAGDNVIALPVAACYALFIRNTHATNTITIKYGVNGGGLVTIIVLQPGAIFSYWSATAVAASSITSLTLNASGAATSVEYFIGG